MEGIELGNRVQVAVGLTETALQEITSVNQLSFIPEYRKQDWGAWLQTLILIKWYVPITGFVCGSGALYQSS